MNEGSDQDSAGSAEPQVWTGQNNAGEPRVGF